MVGALVWGVKMTVLAVMWLGVLHFMAGHRRHEHRTRDLHPPVPMAGRLPFRPVLLRVSSRAYARGIRSGYPLHLPPSTRPTLLSEAAAIVLVQHPLLLCANVPHLTW